MKVYDYLGNELEIEDRIAYARIGSGSDHGTMAVGRIKAISVKPAKYGRSGVDAEIKVDWEPQVKVPGRHIWYHNIKPRPSTVTKPENMVKIG